MKMDFIDFGISFLGGGANNTVKKIRRQFIVKLMHCNRYGELGFVAIGYIIMCCVYMFLIKWCE